MRIRLLPLLILVAALGVGTRLGGVFVEVSGKAQAHSNILATEGAVVAKSLPVLRHHPVAQLAAA